MVDFIVTPMCMRNCDFVLCLNSLSSMVSPKIKAVRNRRNPEHVNDDKALLCLIDCSERQWHTSHGSEGVTK